MVPRVPAWMAEGHCVSRAVILEESCCPEAIVSSYKSEEKKKRGTITEFKSLNSIVTLLDPR